MTQIQNFEENRLGHLYLELWIYLGFGNWNLESLYDPLLQLSDTQDP